MKQIPSHEEILMDELMGTMDWKKLSEMDLPIDYLRMYKDKLIWWRVCDIEDIKIQKVQPYLDEFIEYVDWRCVSEKWTLTADQIRKYKGFIHWYMLSGNANSLKNNPEIIDEFANKWNWSVLCIYVQLPEWILNKHTEKVDWDAAWKNQKCLSYGLFNEEMKDGK